MTVFLTSTTCQVLRQKFSTMYFTAASPGNHFITDVISITIP